MIRLQGVSKVFTAPDGSPLPVLQDISLEVPAGASVALQGPSGSGKSTLLGILAGLEVATTGTVDVAGVRLGEQSERSLAAFRSRNLGFVFQAFHLLGAFSALENVRIAAELAGLDQSQARAKEALARVGLEDRLHHLPAQLSGGECQRVALARAVVAKPPVLLCDEPTGSLDPGHAQRVFDLLLDLHRDLGTTLVLVTHDPALAARMECQLRLERGRLLAGPVRS